MSQPWFFDDVAVDHLALSELAQAADGAAVALETVAAQRLAGAAERLRCCAGPYAEDLVDALVRADGDDADLVAACRALAAAARAASDQAVAEQRHRLALQDTYTAELARDAARAVAAGSGTGTAGTVTGAEAGTVVGVQVDPARWRSTEWYGAAVPA